jgi:hypothetical protein
MRRTRIVKGIGKVPERGHPWSHQFRVFERILVIRASRSQHKRLSVRLNPGRGFQ